MEETMDDRAGGDIEGPISTEGDITKEETYEFLCYPMRRLNRDSGVRHTRVIAPRGIPRDTGRSA
jgi:hypothetical protein